MICCLSIAEPINIASCVVDTAKMGGPLRDFIEAARAGDLLVANAADLAELQPGSAAVVGEKDFPIQVEKLVRVSPIEWGVSCLLGADGQGADVEARKAEACGV